jgi:hypothetical protein
MGAVVVARTWEAKFPHPGLAPTQPTEVIGPSVHNYNEWVDAMRKHNVARSVDTLIAAETRVPLNAVETIALTFGMMLLDGSVPDHDTSIFGALFRGPLG